MTPRMTAELRSSLLRGYENQRFDWGDAYTDQCIAQLNALPPGGELRSPPPDFEEDGNNIDSLTPGQSAALSCDYFGFWGLAAS